MRRPKTLLVASLLVALPAAAIFATTVVPASAARGPSFTVCGAEASALRHGVSAARRQAGRIFISANGLGY